MRMKFLVPTFRRGLNVSIRQGEKYLNLNGEEIEIVATESPEEVLGQGMIIETIPLHWKNEQHVIKGLTAFNQDPAAREINDLSQAMARAYGLNEWGPDVIAILFLVKEGLHDQNDEDDSEEVIITSDDVGNVEDVLGNDPGSSSGASEENPVPESTATSEQPSETPNEESPSTEDPASPSTSEGEADPSSDSPSTTPRADEPLETTPMVTVFTDRGNTRWGYQLSEKGAQVFSADMSHGGGGAWMPCSMDDAPSAVTDAIAQATGAPVN